MRELFFLATILNSIFISAQISNDLDTTPRDSIIQKLNSSYFGAIYKNPDSALTLINTSFLKYDKNSLITSWKNHFRGNYYYGKQNADSALYYFNKVFKTMSAKDDPYLFNETKILSGMVYNNTGRPEDALKKFTEAEKALLKNPDVKPQLKINLFRATGIYFLNSGKHEKSMGYFLKALNIIENDTTESKVKDRVLINLAEVSSLIGDSEETKKYLLLARKEAELTKNDFSIHKVNIKLAEAALNTENTENYNIKNLENAIAFFEKAKQIVNVIEGSLYLGRLLKEQNKIQSAEKSFTKALNISKKIGMPQGIINASLNLGKIKMLQGNTKEAIQLYSDIKDLTSNYSNTQTNIQLQNYLAEAHAANKDFKAAYKNLSTSKTLGDSLNIKERYELSKDLESKYGNDKKQQEIKLLTSQKKLIEQKKKTQRNILLGGLFITSIAGLFLFILYKNRKKTTDKLKQLDSAKSKFFTNISHEFRTPLTLISNPIEELLEDDSISDKQRQQFSMAKRNSDRLLSLVNQLLDLSKIDAGKLKLKIQKGNLKQLLSGLSDSFSYQANQKQINYSVSINQSNDLDAYFDTDAIEKIVVNLISNAMKYTSQDGAVFFNTEIDKNILILEIKNTGVGLNKEESNTIFQRFYQTSEDNIGTGIGLALVKELVDLHKGQITIDSIPNEWTTFRVTLPIYKNSFKKEEYFKDLAIDTQIKTTILPNHIIEDNEQILDNKQPLLLIVEDNADLRTLIKQTFETDYTIITASNGEEGVTLALEHIPDIIISDIMMPIKDGIELTKELKNDVLTSHIPIVLLTAKAGEENELKGIETGADDYITKPFSSKILVAKVAKLLEVREKLQARYSQEIVLTPKDVSISTIDEEFLEKVQTIFDEKLVESSFNIEAFSQGVGMSRMQLHRKIKALTGLTTSEFMRSQRLKLAAELLKKTDVNIAEIGYAVGFNDRSYFTKCFRETFGSAPTSYAKKFAK